MNQDSEVRKMIDQDYKNKSLLTKNLIEKMKNDRSIPFDFSIMSDKAINFLIFMGINEGFLAGRTSMRKEMEDERK